jgi:hypothetical protein
MHYTDHEIETIAQRIVDLTDEHGARGAWLKIADEYPEIRFAEFQAISKRAKAIFDQRIEESRNDVAAMELVLNICEPAFREHPEWTTEQCINHLAAQGDRRAIALKKHLEAQL